MKKSVFFLTLLLCLSLIFPGAHAEDTYVPCLLYTSRN